MKVKKVMTGPVELISSDTSIQHAAQKARSQDRRPPSLRWRTPHCILTDRDLTVRVLAEGRDPVTTKVGDFGSTDLVVCHEDEEASEAERRMQERQVRRLAVVDNEDHLVGILTLGDLATRHNERCGIARTLEILSKPRQSR